MTHHRTTDHRTAGRRAAGGAPRPAPALVSAVAAAALAAGCSGPAGGPSLEPVGFAHRTPLVFDVSRVVFDDRYRPSSSAPNVEHLFRQPPSEVVAAWARDRLRAAGGAGTLRVVLRRAAVVEAPAPAGRRYEAGIDMALEVLDASGARRANVDVALTRSRTVPSGATLGEREAAWHGMARAVGTALDGALEAAARRSLGDWLRPAPRRARPETLPLWNRPPVLRPPPRTPGG